MIGSLLRLARPPRPFPWPEGFARVPDEDWVHQPVESLALKYDTVQDHGWYRNLDRTVADLARCVRPGDVVVDYSGGTGILTSRLLEEVTERDFGILVVDSSAKFLRVALEKLGRHERVAFRLIRYLKDEKRLQLVQEVIEAPLLERGVDAIVSTNAIHLYYDLEDTLRSWHDLLRPDGRLLVQSGNIGLSYMPGAAWIIDETVEAINTAATEIVCEEDAYAAYRDGLEDEERMAAYDALRRKFFLPVRPLEHYLSSLEETGFRIVEVSQLPIEAHVDQWFEFLSAYHEGVLGWVGGSARVEGEDPAPEAIEDRLRLLWQSMERVFEGRPSFEAVWTYITAERAAA
jgi:SAM-dependent methyltransferase